MRNDRKLLAVSAAALAVAFAVDPAMSQPGGDRQRARDPGVRNADSVRARDPGVRGGEPGAGGPLPGLSGMQRAFFEAGLEDFAEVEDVADGLGPRMNLDSCGGCHAHPAVGGSSPAVNPQFAFASKGGGRDRLPRFVLQEGPVREARFVRNPDGSPDGGVHAVFTITGRTGAGGCNLAQPDFEAEMGRRNVIFRIPTPLFGAGLIESIPDDAILKNLENQSGRKRILGIRGKANFRVAGRAITGQYNFNGNDGTLSRFGWKAQNVSGLMFSGEAYNVEMGITNELFQNEREQHPDCQFAAVPNDVQDMDAATALDGTPAIQKFANFQRLLAAPVPSADTPGGAASIGNGRALFGSVGCTLCHTPSMQTSGNASVAALRDRTVGLYSDLVLHDMGEGLMDGVAQGQANGREFRTAPLWGLGQRIFFLHDGRTSDLLQAIREHRSAFSEANGVVNSFFGLPEQGKQDVLNFLRSL
jgi:CxxC motif-containing protein (DUF1111 family)